MPTAPPHFCNEPGCYVLTNSSRCPSHTKSYRGDHRSLYKTAAWLRKRKAVLQSEPYCRVHKAEGQYVPASVVDHIVPFKPGMDFYDDANLQPLCKPHHDSKTAGEVLHPIPSLIGLEKSSPWG